MNFVKTLANAHSLQSSSLGAYAYVRSVCIPKLELWNEKKNSKQRLIEKKSL